MTEYLADVVGFKGHVHAIDVSEQQLDIVKKRLLTKNIINVTLVVVDLSNYQQNLYSKANLVYSRLVLMHLKNMRELLKNKGKISL